MNVGEFLQACAIRKPKIRYDDLLSAAERDYSGDDKKLIGQIIDAHVLTNRKVYLPHVKAQVVLIRLKKEKYGTYREYLIDKLMNETS